MPKSTKKLDAARGRLVAMSSVVLSVIFMIGVVTKINNTSDIGTIGSMFYLIPFTALAAAFISYSWDKRVRILTSLSLGILFASAYICLMVSNFRLT